MTASQRRSGTIYNLEYTAQTRSPLGLRPRWFGDGASQAGLKATWCCRCTPAVPGPPWRATLQLALCSRGLAKRVTEYDGILFGAGMTALQRVSKSAVPVGHDKSRHGPSPVGWRETSAALSGSRKSSTRTIFRTSPRPVCSQTVFFGPLTGSITFLRPPRSAMKR
jgi:hypothetical protein